MPRLAEVDVGDVAEVDLVDVALLRLLTDNLDVEEAGRAVEILERHGRHLAGWQYLAAQDVVAPAVEFARHDVDLRDIDSAVVVQVKVARICERALGEHKDEGKSRPEGQKPTGQSHERSSRT